MKANFEGLTQEKGTNCQGCIFRDDDSDYEDHPCENCNGTFIWVEPFEVTDDMYLMGYSNK